MWAQRAGRDGDHEAAQTKIAAELEKVKQKESLAKIIHETYSKELDRFKSQMEDETRKNHEDEIFKRKQAELAHAKKIAMAKQEVKKRQTLIWASKPKVGAPVLHTSLR